MTEYVCEALSRKHDRKQFDCGVEELNSYLARSASQDVKRKVAAVFVLCPQNDSGRIAGFYTLCSTSIELMGLPKDVQKRLPRYPQVPGVLIGRLARDIDFPGLGTLLLADALSRCVEASKQIAASVIVVDAKDDAARQFHEKFGFQILPRLPSRLFFSMATAEKL
ncbi:hypothetical protein Q31b_33270 [Novipirellula aureliae]|uniref:Acetyltransferase (GNAT) family protein n=1 Tax=Novipirellula aureliae TaxID=2527966 RepID=A0A5C6DX98_9BACT|nr:GNAT family N-acetyltransferase [Novipirellula aureliae]TWU40011.1 hypothetical protein Q31b_33270 [Novipirellula aureliae]